MNSIIAIVIAKSWTLPKKSDSIHQAGQDNRGLSKKFNICSMCFI